MPCGHFGGGGGGGGGACAPFAPPPPPPLGSGTDCSIITFFNPIAVLNPKVKLLLCLVTHN